MLASGALLLSSTAPARAVQDSAYIGINNGTGFQTDPTYVARSIAADQDLGVGSARVGIDDVGGRVVGAPFAWAKRDATIAAYQAANIQVRAVMSPRLMVERDADYDKWKANWRTFAAGVMAHYKGRVFYYIIDNEPDVDYGNGKLSAQQSFDMCQIAYQEAKKIDPRIQIESPPPASPESPILREMIALDIGSVCDFIGMHAYGGQIDEDRMGAPWKMLDELKTTRKPLVISESGAINSYFKNGAQTRRQWFEEYYVQLKRYGYAHAMVFDLDKHEEWALLRQPLDQTAELLPTPAYSALKEGFALTPLGALNGGFESRNDPRYEWYPYTPIEAYDPAHWASFSASGAYRGRNCLRLELAPQTTRYVRRVVGPLVPGRSYTLSAWAKPEDGASAILSANGTQKLEGNRSFRAQTDKAGVWQKLEVRFVPTNSWVVISLDGANAREAVVDQATRAQAEVEIQQGADDDASKAKAEAKARAQENIREATQVASAGVRWDEVELR